MLATIFDGMKKILLDVDEHVKVRFLNFSNDIDY